MGYITFDSSNQTTYEGVINNVQFTVAKYPLDLERHYANTKELQEAYKVCREALAKSSLKPKILEFEDIDLDGLIGHYLNMEFTGIDGRTRNFDEVIVVFPECVYYLGAIYLPNEKNANEHMSTFLSGIHFIEGLTQITPGSILGFSPHQYGKLVGILLILLLPVTAYVIYRIRKRSKKNYLERLPVIDSKVK